MNKVEKNLVRTRKTVKQAADECGVDIDDVELENIDQCSSCSIWLKFTQLKEDLDGNPICKECWSTYGD